MRSLGGKSGAGALFNVERSGINLSSGSIDYAASTAGEPKFQ
jgi:hypothetical protein